MQLTGTEEERIAAAIAFAKAHTADSSTAALLLEILEKATPKRHHETTLPCRIEFVEE